MMNEEKQKFRRFYIIGSLFWLFLLLIFIGGTWIIANGNIEKSDLSEGILHTILVFGIFGIPIIFILSLFIKLAAYIIDKIPKQKP